MAAYIFTDQETFLNVRMKFSEISYHLLIFKVVTIFLTLSIARKWYDFHRRMWKLLQCYLHIVHHRLLHYCDIIMGAMASQVTSLMIVYSAVYLGADQRKHQSSASLAFVRGIPWWPVNSLHKWPVMRKMFPLENLILSVTFLSYLLIKSPQSGVTLCFQFVSAAASAAAAAKTFASHVKTVWAKP